MCGLLLFDRQSAGKPVAHGRQTERWGTAFATFFRQRYSRSFARSRTAAASKVGTHSCKMPRSAAERQKNLNSSRLRKNLGGAVPSRRPSNRTTYGATVHEPSAL